MRRAGLVVAEMHEAVRGAIRPGATTADLDRVARAVLDRRGATSNFLGYHGYPAVMCASVNDVVVHGIPDGSVLVEGDIISIDCGAVVDGYHGDAAFTVGVGEIDAEAVHLIEVTRKCLDAAIAQMLEGNRVGDVGAAVENRALEGNCSIVEGYVGHGIGTAMHERPDVPNVGPAGSGPRLRAGNVLAIEPMLTTGSADTFLDDDGWTARSADGSLAAHFEHTVAVTDAGPLVLTAP